MCETCQELKSQLIFAHNVLAGNLELLKKNSSVYTVVQAAKLMGTSEVVIRDAIKEEKLASAKIKGRRQITGQALDEYVKFYGQFKRRKVRKLCEEQ